MVNIYRSKSVNNLVVGSIGLDTIETSENKVNEVVGGSATYFSNVVKFFGPVQLVGVVGDDFSDLHMQAFSDPAIDLQGLSKINGKTFRWHGKYNTDLSEAETLATELNVFADFVPRIPDSYMKPKTLFLANIDPDLQMGVLSQVEVSGVVALDTMNYWIETKKDSLLRLLPKVDIFFINEEEAKQLSGEKNFLDICKKLASYGPETIVVKRGRAGVVMYRDNKMFVAPSYPNCKPIDTTGAGDSFAGGVMGYIAKTENYSMENYKEALLWGTVAASFAIEDFSIKSFQDLTYKKMSNRFDNLKEIIQF